MFQNKMMDGMVTLQIEQMLHKFAPLSQDEAQSIICGMPSKTCALDLLPTKVLKSY